MKTIIIIMRNIVIAFLVSLSFISCDLGEGESFSIGLLPIAKVEMETAFAVDSITEIEVKYLRPTNCHFFEDFYYEKAGFTRNVAIYSSKFERENCQTYENDTVVVALKFRPDKIGTYEFKFWKGVNSSGQDEFYEYDAIVNH